MSLFLGLVWWLVDPRRVGEGGWFGVLAGEPFGVVGVGGGEAAWSMTSMVAERLCGSIPMMTAPTPSSSTRPSRCQRGGERFFELGRPLLSHSPAMVTDEPHAK